MYNKLESTEDAADSKDNFSTGLFFNKFNPILAIGYSRSLTFQDIPELPYKLKCEHSFQKLRSLIRKKVDNKPNKKSEPRLTNFRLSFLYFWTLTKCYYQPILYLNLVKLVSSVLSFFFPVLLGVYVDYFDNFESSDEYLLKGCIITFILFASQVLSSVLNSHFTIAAAKFELELKGANILAVFKTSIGFKLSEKSYSKLSNSKLLNIVQIDVEKAVETIKSFIDLWSIPLQVVIAFILLYYQVKLAFLAGLAAIVLMIPINSLIAKNIANATTKLMIQKDSRIAILSESFKGILGLKCGGLETDILNLSNAYRKKEVRYLSIRKYLDAVCVYLWATMPILVPYATFTASLLVVGSEDLDSAKVLTTLALLNMLIFPMNAFPWVLNGIMEGCVSAYRVMDVLYYQNTFLANEEDDDSKVRRVYTNSSSNVNQEDFCTENASVTLKHDDDRNETFRLGPISFHPLYDKVNVIVGPVGAGKTALLQLLLGEIVCEDGLVSNQLGLIGYTAQNPVLHRGTIRENVFFNSLFQKARYDVIIKGMCLDEDFASDSLKSTGGDNTMLAYGSKNLSGGQKLRVAIARALYSSSPVILLDDPFSALDQIVSKKVYDFIVKLCNEEARLLIVSSQSLHNFDEESRSVLFLENGGVVSSSGRLQSKEIQSKQFHVSQDSRGTNTTTTSNSDNLRSADGDENFVSDSVNNQEQEMIEAEREAEKEEEMKSGGIKSEVLKRYFQACGYIMCILIVLSTLMMQASANINGLWLVYWSKHIDSISNTRFIQISSALLIFNMTAAMLRSVSFASGCLNSAKKLYRGLILNLFACPITMFEEVSFGQLFNRIGQDTNVIDDQLPFVLNIVLAQSFVIIGTVVIMAYILPPIIIVLFISVILYHKLQKYYRESSRQLRRLENVSKSPIYALYSESLDNGPTIRALNAKTFIESKFVPIVNTYLALNITQKIGSQWLGIRLQLLGAFITCSVASFAIISLYFNLFSFDGAQLGLALVYSLSIVNNLNGFVSSFADTEQSMVSVERVIEFTDLKNEDESCSFEPSNNKSNYSEFSSNQYTPLLNADVSVSASIPSLTPSPSHLMVSDDELCFDGAITMSNVSMAYKPDLPLTLRDINLEISSGQKIALVGRTGSGKSSIFRVLLRLNEYTGSVKLSGRELRQFSPRFIRRNITVIPQEPLIFSGTIGFNLDPGGNATRDELVEVIHYIQLANTFSQIDSGNNNNNTGLLLDYNLPNAGETLSQGQKQLICLGRAMLKKCKIILIDEGTSSLDENIEKIFFEVLNTCFKSSTVILISHKLQEIDNYCDKILELSRGRIIKCVVVK